LGKEKGFRLYISGPEFATRMIEELKERSQQFSEDSRKAALSPHGAAKSALDIRVDVGQKLRFEEEKELARLFTSPLKEMVAKS
jgi:hypothetical protein